ncbi:MAG: FUN14 domain-containing protein [Candidatus Chromulinivorax sp.]|nr:FUN14 domain-containing protein [Candidatus Chromulinivorax sp.]
MHTIKALFWEKKSQLEIWFQNLHFSSLDFIRCASFFGVGFLLGLFFKRWSKYIILVAMSLALVLAILQGFSIITVNFTTIQRLTGLQSITNMQSIFLACMQTAHKYVYELSCSGIGFIIGFKTG